MNDYGVFANIVAIALALIATFSMLLLKMLGKMNQWIWLTDETPSFLVTAGSRMIAVAFMAVTYVTINQSNYFWFEIAVMLIGGLGFLSVVRFEHLRKRHIVQIPLIDKNGQQLENKKKKLLFKNVVIGLESELQADAKKAFDKARKQNGGLSLLQFMAGYGAQKLNDPEALWNREVLANISNKLSITLMYIVLSAVTVLFLAAFIIEVAGRNP